jgi:hypothetical protein
VTLQHARTGEPLFSFGQAERLEDVALPSKGPTHRVWLPSRRCKPFRSRKPFSAPHAHGLRPSELCSDLVARPRFPAADPLLRFPARPESLTAALQRFPLTKPAAHPAPAPLLETGWCRCSPELLRLSGPPPPDLGRSTFLLPSPLALSFPTSEDAENRGPRGFLPAGPHLPSFEGREPVWRFRPTASADPSEREPVAAYFFGLERPGVLTNPRTAPLSNRFRPS